jgi:hypothetical protein
VEIPVANDSLVSYLSYVLKNTFLSGEIFVLSDVNCLALGETT